MKVDIECNLRDGAAEIGISLLGKVSRSEFEEYADILKREGFEYDPYTKSNFFTTKDPKMLSAMLRFLDREFEVTATLKGKRKYTWEEREQFIQEFSESVSQ